MKQKMKFKVLIVILVMAVIILGVLFGMKIMQNMNNSEETNGNSLLDIFINKKEEEEVPKSKYYGTKRTLAVVIDNVGSAVPQASLNEAMIVYEAIVEGKLTRFLAIYKDPKVETIGPARSARPYFIDYAMENDSIFVHYGGSPKALDEVEKLGINNVNGIQSPGKVFWRTNKKTAPHNAMVDVAEVWKYAETKGYRTTTSERNVLNYVVDEVNIEDGDVATAVTIPYKSDNTVKFKYNSETKLYERYVNDKLQKDFLTNEALTTKNIIITFANNYTTDEENGYGRQAIENIGTLDGYYITNGMARKIKCKKTSRSGRTSYQDSEGNEIEVNDGNTYIQIVPPSMKIVME